LVLLLLIQIILPPGQQTNPSKDLYFGWNLIGYFDPMGNYADDYLHAAMARDLMASLGSDWSILTGWDASSQQYETSITRYEDYRLTYPKKGYWLWMNADRYLAVSTNQRRPWLTIFPLDISVKPRPEISIITPVYLFEGIVYGEGNTTEFYQWIPAIPEFTEHKGNN
jgi:hypothetical protein